MRKFKGLRTGKYVAQGAHASIAFLTTALRTKRELTAEEKEWIDGPFTKICVSVNSEEELNEIILKAREAKLNVHVIIDSGKTEFHGVPTLTCAAIGPNKEEDIDPITKELSLL